MVLQNGGDLKNPVNQRSYDALDYYTHFAKGQNRVWDETMPSSALAFAGGNLAMYFGPSTKAADIKNTNPLLKFKVVPVPQLEGGKVAWASYWAIGVSANLKDKKAQGEAWKFVKYLQSLRGTSCLRSNQVWTSQPSEIGFLSSFTTEIRLPPFTPFSPENPICADP